ncbi:peroxiredoxin family protein [Singulisphaera sp. PoT]|uniref:peroxiredoxin family protein n=1 Tax=Singulisphaera sp. PoT TaxID=3411797 RepID=UPI003BF4913B
MFSLMLICALAQGSGKAAPAPASPRDVLDSFLQEWKVAVSEMTRTREAAKDEKSLKLWNDENRRRTHDFGRRALDLASRFPSSPEAVDALMWVVNQGYSPEAGRALETLRKDYITSPKLTPACIDTRRVVLGEFEEVENFLRSVQASSPHREVRGQACFAMAIFLQWYADTLDEWAAHPEYAAFFEPALGADRLKAFRSRDPKPLRQEAARLYEKVADKYGDLKDRRGRSLSERSAGELTELRRLKIGQAAPEIDGMDAEGHRFRLSEFKGRVVALSFSGNWCGPCRAAYPHERELVERLKGRKFAALSVNTDPVETLKKSIAAGEITWRCWADGGVEGPITEGWGVDSFPTTYVLDASGVIRFKNLQGKDLDEAIDKLLTEADRK